MLNEMNFGDHFICDAINDGLPLCCVTSTDNFLLHDNGIYKGSIIISPLPRAQGVLQKLSELKRQGVGVIIYGAENELSKIDDAYGFEKIDIQGSVSAIRNVLAKYGYVIEYNKKAMDTKPPTLAISKHDNALFFSAYNANTTTDTKLKLPQGAPILCGMEAEIVDGCSVYHFARGEHRECRIFVEQEDGVISCREAPPKSTRYRRAICIRGLKNATVRLFSEKTCECAVSTIKTSYTPIYDERFTPAYDEVYGPYLKGENVSGEIYFMIGYKNTAKE